MSKTSKLCNDIKSKIDSISGLDDDVIYNQLLSFNNFIDSRIEFINSYILENELFGTIFKDM